MLDLNAFFDGVTSYFKPEKHPELFPSSITQDSGVFIVHDLIKPPLELSEDYKIDEIYTFLGCYNLQQIELYLTQLTSIIKNNAQQILIQPNHNVSFLLSSTNHAIMINYNLNEHKWSVVDANQLNATCDFYNDELDMSNMAQKLLDAFECIDSPMEDKVVGFSTKIFRAMPKNQEKKINIYTAFSDVQLKGMPLNSDLTQKIASTLLYLAAKNNNEQTIEELLIDHKESINVQTKEGWTPLNIAVSFGHTKIVEMLLNAGANVDIPKEGGRTPLRIAAQLGHIEIVKMLLNAGANVDIPKKDGWTPLNTAVYFGYTKIVEMLLNAGANVDIPKEGGRTPLHIAAQLGHIEIVKMLLNAGANVNIINKGGFIPLQIAAHNNHPDVLKILLKHQAPVLTRQRLIQITSILGLEEKEIKNILKILPNSSVIEDDSDLTNLSKLLCNSLSKNKAPTNPIKIDHFNNTPAIYVNQNNNLILQFNSKLALDDFEKNFLNQLAEFIQKGDQNTWLNVTDNEAIKQKAQEIFNKTFSKITTTEEGKFILNIGNSNQNNPLGAYISKDNNIAINCGDDVIKNIFLQLTGLKEIPKEMQKYIIKDKTSSIIKILKYLGISKKSESHVIHLNSKTYPYNPTIIPTTTRQKRLEKLNSNQAWKTNKIQVQSNNESISPTDAMEKTSGSPPGTYTPYTKKYKN